MQNFRSTLLSNGSATGNAVAWIGGRGTLTVEGTVGGATLALQMKSMLGTWIPANLPNSLTAIALTAAGTATFELPPCDIRVTVTGGVPSALYVYAQSNDSQ